MSQAERNGCADGNGVISGVDENCVPSRNRSNDCLIDRRLQKTSSCGGVEGPVATDLRMQDSLRLMTDMAPAERLEPFYLGVLGLRGGW